VFDRFHPRGGLYRFNQIPFLRTVTKSEIIEYLAEEHDMQKADVRRCVQGTLDLIRETIATEGRIELRNFGIFEVETREARKGINPRTREEVFIPEKRVVKFKEGKLLREMVQGKVEPSTSGGS